MKNYLLILGAMIVLSGPIYAQKYKTVSGTTKFFSDAPLEDIEAITKKVTSIIDADKGDMAFLIPISSFDFEKKLMQEHFNENYLESEKYPNASFKGKLSNYDPAKKGVQKVQAKGQMTIHGVTKDISVEGTIDNQGDKMLLKAKFPITVADHKIKIPKVVFYNIAEVVEVTLDLTYEKQ